MYVMYVILYVCMPVCMSVCLCVCVFVYVYVNVYSYAYVSVCTYFYVYRERERGSWMWKQKLLWLVLECSHSKPIREGLHHFFENTVHQRLHQVPQKNCKTSEKGRNLPANERAQRELPACFHAFSTQDIVLTSNHHHDGRFHVASLLDESSTSWHQRRAPHFHHITETKFQVLKSWDVQIFLTNLCIPSLHSSSGWWRSRMQHLNAVDVALTCINQMLGARALGFHMSRRVHDFYATSLSSAVCRNPHAEGDTETHSPGTS